MPPFSTEIDDELAAQLAKVDELTLGEVAIRHALTIMQLHEAMKGACDLLAERTYGNDARSPSHNARLLLESALSSQKE